MRISRPSTSVQVRVSVERKDGVMRVGTNVSYQPRWQSDELPAPTITTTDMKRGGAGWVLTDGKYEATPVSNGKPPYRVPSMSEIAAIPWNGFNVVSTSQGRFAYFGRDSLKINPK